MERAEKARTSIVTEQTNPVLAVRNFFNRLGLTVKPIIFNALPLRFADGKIAFWPTEYVMVKTHFYTSFLKSSILIPVY